MGEIVEIVEQRRIKIIGLANVRYKEHIVRKFIMDTCSSTLKGSQRKPEWAS